MRPSTTSSPCRRSMQSSCVRVCESEWNANGNGDIWTCVQLLPHHPAVGAALMVLSFTRIECNAAQFSASWFGCLCRVERTFECCLHASRRSRHLKSDEWEKCTQIATQPLFQFPFNLLYRLGGESRKFIYTEPKNESLHFIRQQREREEKWWEKHRVVKLCGGSGGFWNFL